VIRRHEPIWLSFEEADRGPCDRRAPMMEGRWTVVSVPMLRDAAMQAVARASLRQVARAIGVSAPGLKLFLNGGAPRRETQRKLMEWYIKGVETQEISTDVAAIAMALLLARLPDGAAKLQTEHEVLAAIRRGHESAGIIPPQWVRMRT
jgi:hypothetical protein